MSLADKKCEPCRGGVPPMEPENARKLLAELGEGWNLTHDDKRIEKAYEFKDFAAAMAFAVKVGDIAEEQGHHPDLHVGWGRVGFESWTHKINGLAEADFILAAKADRAFLAQN